MAGDWIKMRVDLYRDPKVCALADVLMDADGDLARYINQNMQRDMCVTRNVMRNVAVGALLSVWGVMRSRGKRLDDDLVCRGVTSAVIDDIAEVQGFGAAMLSVGWVEEIDGAIVFPRFFEEHNTDPAEAAKQKNAERQRRFREKKQAEKCSVTDNVTVTHREEKRREEITPTTDVVGESALKPRPARKCPEGFEVTPAMQDWATINAPLVNLDQATATFRDHTFKTAIADWAGAWRNWMRREQQYTTDRQRPGARPAVNRQEAIEQRNRAVGDEWLRQQEALDASQ